jgi:gas vesicle protein
MKMLRFFEGFVLGGVVGAAVAMLFAPESGQDLRGRFQNETNRIRNEVNQAALQRRMELRQQLDALRQPQQH